MRIEFTKLNSKAILAMEYVSNYEEGVTLADSDGTLTVTFTSGRVYDYLNVQFRDVMRVANAETRNSIGATFSLWIRDDYSYREVVEAF
mgnify:FL=1